MELCLIVPFLILQFPVVCRTFAKKKDGILELISCSIHSYRGNFVYFVNLQEHPMTEQSPMTEQLLVKHWNLQIRQVAKYIYYHISITLEKFATCQCQVREAPNMPNGTLLDSQFYLIYMSDGRDTKFFLLY